MYRGSCERLVEAVGASHVYGCLVEYVGVSFKNKGISVHESVVS